MAVDDLKEESQRRAIEENPKLVQVKTSAPKKYIGTDPASSSSALRTRTSSSSLAERSGSVEEISRSMVEVNEIFKDLASLVSEQNESIDSIESNISDASMRVDRASSELRRY